MKLLTILISLFCASSFASAANYYVRAGASGAKNGGNWKDAWTELPAKLNRGDTYYIAAGNYTGYLFDDPALGAQVITIKKATPADHGTNEGWQASYAEPASFLGRVAFNSSNWVFDGQTGGGPESWTNGFGFKIYVTGQTSGPGLIISLSNQIAVTNVLAQHFEVIGNGGDGRQQNKNDAITIRDNSRYNTIRYIYTHNMGRCHFFIGGDNNTIEYAYTGSYESVPDEHAQIASIWRGLSSMHLVRNITFRNCVFAYMEGSGGITMDGGNLTVVGCVFFRPAGTQLWGSNGAIGAWTVSSLDNVKVHNCTFMDLRNNEGSVRPYGSQGMKTNWDLRNNIYYNCDVSLLPGTSSHNIYASCSNAPSNESNSIVLSGNPISGWQSLNFVPDSATAAGIELGSICKSDPCGVLRGADGTWDRGAYEYSQIQLLPIEQKPAPPTNLRVAGR